MGKANNRGKYYEKKSKELLESQGYKVEQAKAKLVWIKGRPLALSHDFFGLFDLIGIRPDGIKLVQVKFKSESNDSGLGEIRNKMTAFPAPVATKELHIWKMNGRRAELIIEAIS